MSGILNRIKPAQEKSRWGAFALVFFFGPLGALYVGIKFAALYFVILVGAAVVTAGFGAAVVWLFYLFWSFESVGRFNEAEVERVKLEEAAKLEAYRGKRLEERRHREVIEAIRQGKTQQIPDTTSQDS